MKVLVVCVPRSGTTSFLNSLKKVTSTPLVCLPDSYEYSVNHPLITKVLNFNDIILRVVPSQYVGMSIIEFSKHFDHIILMSRRNEKEHMESYINLLYKKTVLKKIVSNAFYNNDVEYDFSTIPNDFVVKFENSTDWKLVRQTRSQIEDLAKHLNTEILYYEDLYYTDDKTEILTKFCGTLDVNVEKLIRVLNSTKKLRRSTTKILI